MKVFILISTTVILFSVTCCTGNKTSAPILVLGTEAGFGTYVCEILKAEGWNEFIFDSINSKEVNSSFLEKFDLVILGEASLKEEDRKLVTGYVRSGGNLIAFHPDTALAELFGISGYNGTMTGGNLVINSRDVICNGLINRQMQFHGIAERYSKASAGTIASFKDNSISEEEFPAVVHSTYGKGHAVAFLYNLPQSIVLTRQGNPALAGLETDSINGLRAMDLFTGGWLQPTTNTLNQADEQMRLLSRCMENLFGLTRPLPRLWYFPDSLRCMVTLTNDGETNNENDFEPQFRDVDSLNGRMTIYIMETEKVSRDWTDKWTGRGFEISGHPDNTSEAGDPKWNNVSDVLERKQKEISEMYGLTMNTIVNHWFVWCGKDSSGNQEFAAQAEIEASHGIGMDINYAHYDNNSWEGHFLGPLGANQGNFTGSGLPMKFASSGGKVLNIYQHLNNVYDQQYMENKDTAGFFDCFKGLMDRSIDEEVYSFISVKSHNDEYKFSRKPLIQMLEYAKNRDVPVWTASELLDFLRVKEAVSFQDFKWSEEMLSFRLISPVEGKAGLTFFIPAENENRPVSEVNIDGQPELYHLRSFKGKEYAFLTVRPGQDYDISVFYR